MLDSLTSGKWPQGPKEARPQVGSMTNEHMGLSTWDSVTNYRAAKLKVSQDIWSQAMKVTTVAEFPSATRGREAKPNPLQELCDKIIADSKPRHLVFESKDEMAECVKLLNRGFRVRQLALKTRRDVENALGMYIHYGPKSVRGPRKPKTATDSTLSEAAD